MKKILFYSIVLFVFASCQNQTTKQADNSSASNANSQTLDENKLMADATNYFKTLPIVADVPENAVTPEKVILGKKLYYDNHLSKTGNNSCNSCHNLETYGVDNKATSTGDAGRNGSRNSPTVLNAALHGMQFWDGRAKNVEEQAGMPIMNPIEMAIPNKNYLVKKLSASKDYAELFAKAFPDQKSPVTFDNLQNAIGAFERTLLTPSKFDAYLNGDKNALTMEEKHGLKTYMDAGCTTCHNGVAVGGTMLQKFGVTADYMTLTGSKTEDEGRKNVTKQDADKDFFKVPGLRNIAKTYPYFHDGSVADLNQAIAIMGKAQLNKNLTEEEVKSIALFLKTLTGQVPQEALQSKVVALN